MTQRADRGLGLDAAGEGRRGATHGGSQHVDGMDSASAERLMRGRKRERGKLMRRCARQNNFALVQGSKYATAAEAVAA